MSDSSSNSSISMLGYGKYEEPDDYKPGGRHPLHVGEFLKNGRYGIMNRLGSGTFSTVWLAFDESSTEHRFVAVKVLTAEASKRVSVESSLHTGNKKSGRSFVVEILDRFKITGPNGVHQCLVTELLGPTVGAVLNAVDRGLAPKLGVQFRKRLILECLNGVAELHSRGVVHGDLHKGNLAFTFPAHIQSMSPNDLQEALGRPYVHEIEPSPENPLSHPKYLLRNMCIQNAWSLCTSANHTPSLRIFDFTESFLASAPPSTLPGTALGLAAPEQLLADINPAWRERVGPGIDVWAWACAAFPILSEDLKWGPFVSYCTNTFGEQLADVMFTRRETVGERTWEEYMGTEEGMEWWKINAAGSWERSNGDWTASNWEERPGWEKRVAWLEENLGPKEGGVVRRVLERALVVEPEDRVGAEELRVMLERVWGDVLRNGGGVEDLSAMLQANMLEVGVEIELVVKAGDVVGPEVDANGV